LLLGILSSKPPQTLHLKTIARSQSCIFRRKPCVENDHDDELIQKPSDDEGDQDQVIPPDTLLVNKPFRSSTYLVRDNYEEGGNAILSRFYTHIIYRLDEKASPEK
jgi:hypothetical protein